jgi:hypothetical protein
VCSLRHPQGNELVDFFSKFHRIREVSRRREITDTVRYGNSLRLPRRFPGMFVERPLNAIFDYRQ